MKHTPGPWRATYGKDARSNPAWRIDNESVALMAQLLDVYHDMSEEIAANAKLMAAAPRMLDGLLDARAFLKLQAKIDQWNPDFNKVEFKLIEFLDNIIQEAVTEEA